MSRKVLVVDDEKLIVKGIRFSLEQDGMEVDCAYDGEEAVEKAKDKKYDIILLDLMLPKMDGLEVCQQIREFSNVPIVMLTLFSDLRKMENVCWKRKNLLQKLEMKKPMQSHFIFREQIAARLYRTALHGKLIIRNYGAQKIHSFMILQLNFMMKQELFRR